MAVEVLLPKVGLTMTEGTVTEVHVPDGTAIEIGDALVTVSTDKVDVDIEAESAGIFHVGVQRGATLEPGAVVGWVVEPGEAPPTAGSPASGTAAANAAEADEPAPPTSTTTTGSATVPAGDRDGRLRASPNARRVAAELGVDLASVRGTGPEGRIVSEDVEDAAGGASTATSPAPGPGASPVVDTPAASRLRPPLRRLARSLGVDPASVPPTGPGGSLLRSDIVAAGRTAGVPSGAPELDGNAVTRVVPLTGMRGTIARRMHASLQESAQLTHGYHVALDAVIDLRDRMKAESVEGETVPSINDFVVKAAALALRDHPGLNATIVDDEIRELADIHVGVAVAVPGGLFVPVVRHADELTLREIAEETRALAVAAREGRLSLGQLEGGTFAVTSLGAYGVDFFTPVINPGNVGILGVGQARDGIRWEGDRPVRTREVTLSLTFDHRAVDGAPAAEYLRTVERLLSRPLRLLLD
jgi:pyruvate/2-oxoglutarate dehydrogenase complex dihydrolipoamide acyltransferase (E2) component